MNKVSEICVKQNWQKAWMDQRVAGLKPQSYQNLSCLQVPGHNLLIPGHSDDPDRHTESSQYWE